MLERVNNLFPHQQRTDMIKHGRPSLTWYTFFGPGPFRNSLSVVENTPIRSWLKQNIRPVRRPISWSSSYVANLPKLITWLHLLNYF